MFVLLACTPAALPPQAPPPTPTPVPGLQSAIDDAAHFLIDQHSPPFYLLRESPIVAPNRYWLATDNLLATYALDAAGVPEMAERIRYGLEQYGNVRHGLIEALIGETVEWPPHVEEQRPVSERVWTESRTQGPQYLDWKEYADFALYGALVAHNDGDNTLAATRYREAVATFDGVGFPDLAYQNRAGGSLYATYKLALAVFVGSAIGEPPSSAVLSALLSKQEAETGGFITLYDGAGVPQGDASTETTSYALLALSSLRD